MFCPRCGAELADSARFCERCGHRVEDDDAGRAGASAAPSGSGLDWRLVAGVAAIVVVLAAVGILAATGAFDTGEGDGDGTAQSTSAPATTPTASPSPATPTATAEPETDEEAPPRPAKATVEGTCGRGGVGGDCVLSVREQPSSAAPELRRLSEGDSLQVSCQVHGESVHSSALDASSTVWSSPTTGGYVANVYLAGARLSPSEITLPKC